MPKAALTICFVLTLLLPALDGCKSRNMDLKKASEIAVKIGEEGQLSVPPRHLDDINALLARQDKPDSKAVARFRQIIAEEPPAGASPSEQASFLFKRGRAAWELGRLSQALQDLRAAQKLDEADGTLKEPGILLWLGKAELESGDFRQAAALLERLRETSHNPAVYGMLVATYMRLGELDKAKAVMQSDLKRAEQRKHKQDDKLAQRGEADMQAAFLAGQGKLKEAEVYQRKAIKFMETVGDRRPAESVLHRMRLVRNLMGQERLLDAELEARHALSEAVQSGGEESALVGQALQLLGEVVLAQGRVADARNLALKVIELQKQAGLGPESFLVCRARVFYADSLAASEDYPAAVEQYKQAEANLRSGGYAIARLISYNPNYLLALLLSGQPEAVSQVLGKQDGGLLKLGPDSYQATELQALRAAAYSRQGKLDEAGREFLSSMPGIMNRNAGDGGDHGRNQRMRAIILEYVDYLNHIQGTPQERKLGVKASDLAFQAADAFCGRSVRQALAASAARAAASDPGLADLVRRQQDTASYYEVLQADMLDAAAGQASKEDLRGLGSKLAEIKSARDALEAEIKRRFPQYSDFVNPAPPLPGQASALLRPGELLLAFLPGPRATYYLALTQSGKLSFGASPATQKELESEIRQLRKSLDLDVDTLAAIPAYDAGLASKLYQDLFKPVEAELGGIKELLIVAPGPLGRLPFAALLTAKSVPGPDKSELFDRYKDQPWLAERYAVSLLPSLSSFVTLRVKGQASGQDGSFAGFGDPLFSPAQAKGQGSQKLETRGKSLSQRSSQRGGLESSQANSLNLEQLESLPDTREELLSIAGSLGADKDKDLFLGAKASRSQVMSQPLDNKKVLAFATHALLPGDLDGLDEPALALSSPAVTGKPDDGPLTLSDILKLKLNANWVALSACNTGAGQGAGAEAASGLGRAFFYAGARAILVSQWAVETTSAAKLTTRLFAISRDRPELSRGEALRQSMLELLKGPGLPAAQGKASYAHPFFWAAFVLIGDTGGK